MLRRSLLAVVITHAPRDAGALKAPPLERVRQLLRRREKRASGRSLAPPLKKLLALQRPA